jgi:catechol 2,3-dioxygenase-like lactoylglutathione lyase family enzyme
MAETLEKIKPLGVKVEQNSPRQAFVTAPEDVRVELLEDPTISSPVEMDHVHIWVTAPPEVQAWYVQHFGAVAGKRGRFDAANIPGVALLFNQQDTAQAPTKGRSLDHIGFEVANLDETAKKLKAAGIKMDVEPRLASNGTTKVAFLTDPWGTYIELTQGLAPAKPPQSAGAAEQQVRPALLFREEWKQPPYTGKLNDENRRVTQDAVTNPNLELKLYGTDARNLSVYVHEGRHDLWTGMVTSPVAATLRDKNNYIDLTGLARLQCIVRTQSLHVLHPVVKLADGTLLAGSHSDATEGEYIQSEISFANQHWFKLDPQKVVTSVEVKNPDLSRVDEIGFVDLMPGGGHGNAGWSNISAVQLYAQAVPRDSASR